MQSVLVLVGASVTLTDVGAFLAGQGVHVESRQESRGGDYLLCRADEGSSWEISLEESDSVTFDELEDADQLHIRGVDAVSVFLIAYRRSAFAEVHRLISRADWSDVARYLAGDGSGVSYPVRDHRDSPAGPGDLRAS
ncbi:hypothetical protein ACH4UY_04030 [Streptomyces longwoodensis]|uniref:hypothetical protein n=1 Tax=Streptomyces longwoodensis TaxID=68231 RepID=UPI0037900DCE